MNEQLQSSSALPPVERELLDYSDDILGLLDTDLRIQVVNKNYRQMFGQPREYFIGRTLREVFAHDVEHYDKVIHPLLIACLETGETSRFAQWVPVPGHGELYLEIQYIPVRDEEGRIKGIAVNGRNRTEVLRSITALEHSEAMLKRSEQIAGLGGWALDVDTGQMHWTDEMFRIHEVAPDFNPTTGNIGGFIVEEDQPQFRTWIDRLFSAGESAAVLCRLTTARGNLKWVRSTGFPVFENGKLCKIEGVLHDVTELITMQQQLRENEEKYRKLVEESNAMVWEGSLDTERFDYISPQAETMTGYTQAEWCSEGFLFKHIHPDDLPHVREQAQQAIMARKDLLVEYRFVKPDGSHVWLRDDIRVIRDDSGNAVRLRGVMIDITGLKEMQLGLNRALRALESHQQILDQHTILATTDAEGRLTYVNEKFVEISGYMREELLGQTHCLLKSGEHDDAFYAGIWQAVTAGNVWQGEICNRNKAGHLYWVYSTIVPMRNDAGFCDAYMSVTTDISSVKAGEATLRRAQKMEAIGQLTGGIAHDFNNLLGIVVGSMDLMEQKLDGDSQLQTQLENARNAALRGSVLTRRLLNFSRQSPVQAQAQDMNRILLGLEVLISKSLTALVNIKMALVETPWPVEVDAGDLEDAIINLCINASDAMPKGGTLTFTTRNIDNREGKLRPGLPAGYHVELCVADTGNGMDEHTLARIFDPYFTTKSHDKGSGLGLPMVYAFVQRSKGQIFVESEPDKGSRFLIYLPRSHQQVQSAQSARTGEAQQKLLGNGETILLVDDEQDILSTTATTLELLGYKVIACNQGETALEKLRQHSADIDILFTDVVMPGGLDGFSLAEAALQIKPGLKLLFTSGYAHDDLQAGRDEWRSKLLAKPYRRNELARRIRDTLDLV